MRILLTNDDGYHAPGLAVLERIARQLSDDVGIVAPAEEQSGSSRSLTLTRPIRVRAFDERRFAVAGTPTDAVMMALGQLMADTPPDLILSGVNRDANLGEDALYSGTVSAAMEGALAGIRSIAISQCRTDESSGDPAPFETADALGFDVLRPLAMLDMPPRTLLNVNFPAIPPQGVKGVRVTRQGLRDYGRVRHDKRTDPRGHDYYWLQFGRVPHTPDADTDLEAVGDGYVAVTPLHLDLTHNASLQTLAAAYR